MSDNKKPTATYATERFYLKNLALQGSFSSNGAFIQIAEPEKNSDKFKWPGTSVKLSNAELSNLAYGMELLRTKGETAWFAFCEAICGKDKKGEPYKNLIFVHKKGDKEFVLTGLNYYSGGLQYVIQNNAKKIDLKFYIGSAEKMKFEYFLKHLVTTSFTANEYLTHNRPAAGGSKAQEDHNTYDSPAHEDPDDKIIIPEWVLTGFINAENIDELNKLDKLVREDPKGRYNGFANTHKYDDFYNMCATAKNNKKVKA